MELSYWHSHSLFLHFLLRCHWCHHRELTHCNTTTTYLHHPRHHSLRLRIGIYAKLVTRRFRDRALCAFTATPIQERNHLNAPTRVVGRLSVFGVIWNDTNADATVWTAAALQCIRFRDDTISISSHFFHSYLSVRTWSSKRTGPEIKVLLWYQLEFEWCLRLSILLREYW
jgi:hypothetical protein